MKQLNRGGRPSKLTPSVVLRLVTLICQGKSIEEATWSAGVGQSTVYRWMALGRNGDPRFEGLAEALKEAHSAAGSSKALISLALSRCGRRL
jgi:hypothetical protein